MQDIGLAIVSFCSLQKTGERLRQKQSFGAWAQGEIGTRAVRTGREKVRVVLLYAMEEEKCNGARRQECRG